MFEYQENYFESPKYILRKERKAFNKVGFALIGMIIVQIIIIPLVFLLIGGFLYQDMFVGQIMPFLTGGSYFLTTPMGYSTMIVASVVLNVVPFLFYSKSTKLTIGDLLKGGNKLSLKVYFVLIAVCMTVNLAAAQITNILSLLFEKTSGSPLPSLDLSLTGFNIESILMAISICIIAPAIEEIIFRGFLLRAFSKKGEWFAVVVSAMLFSITHGNIPQALGAFFIGILFGFIAIKTKSLVAPIILHIINNTLASVSDIATKNGSEGLAIIILVLLLAFVICALTTAIIYIRKLIKHEIALPQRVKHNGYFVLLTSATMVIYAIFYVGLIVFGLISPMV